MSAARTFTELRMWQRSRTWSKDIFWKTQDSPFRTDRRLVVQINDSSESVMSNIAEGFGRGTQAEFIKFLGYSIGSLDETCSHLCAAYDRSYLDKAVYQKLFAEGIEIRKMIIKFIGSMVLPGSGAKYRRKPKDWTNEVWETYERFTGQKRPELFAQHAARIQEQANGRK